jgi:hypothetical protein
MADGVAKVGGDLGLFAVVPRLLAGFGPGKGLGDVAGAHADSGL